MSKNSTLQLLGLSNTASKVYATLLHRPPLAIADIARLTGKHRPIIYQAISELLKKGLITTTSSGKRLVYKAESPALLTNLLKSSTSILEGKIQEYTKLYENKDSTPKVSSFQGKTGIATAYEQFINNIEKRGKIYRYESPRDHQVNKKLYPSLYWKRAGATGDVDKFVITNQKTDLKRRKSLNRFSKSFPSAKDAFEYNITQLIGNDRVLFIDFDTQTAIIIENKRLADYQKSLFKIFFDRL